MSRSQRIREKIAEIQPAHLEVEDVSHQHQGHGGYGVESHFRILVVSDAFRGESPISRQKRIHRLLAEEFQRGLHALELKLLTPEERKKRP